MRLTRFVFAFAVVSFFAVSARAEYFVLRSGQRLSVTGYQLLGDHYQLQLRGGSAQIAADEVVSIEPEEEFTRQPEPAPVQGDFADLIRKSADRYGMDAHLIASVIAAESNFNPKAVSRKNARGLMQLLPETAKRLGVHNIFDPAENIDAGTKYLSTLMKRYNNNLVLALAAYNAGPDRVQKYGRVPPYSETITYVKRIQADYAKRKPSASTALKSGSGGL